MFKGTSNIFHLNNTEILDINMKFWLDSSFLNIGAFFNITIPTSGNYGGQYSRLIPIKDRFKSNGTVWKTFHNNLVWEENISFETQPVSISGVYVNGIFTTDYNIDYPNGRIIFDTPIATSSIVEMEYSYKWLNIYSSSEINWLDELDADNFRVDRQDYSLNSGTLINNGPQIPCIVYDVVGRNYSPYQLGGGQYSNTILSFFILSNNRNTNKKLADILSEQNEKTINLFNPQIVAESGVFPLNISGNLNTGYTYNQLTQDYFYNVAYLKKANIQSTQEFKNGIFYTPVQMTAEVILPSI